MGSSEANGKASICIQISVKEKKKEGEARSLKKKLYLCTLTIYKRDI